MLPLARLTRAILESILFVARSHSLAPIRCVTSFSCSNHPHRWRMLPWDPVVTTVLYVCRPTLSRGSRAVLSVAEVCRHATRHCHVHYTLPTSLYRQSLCHVTITSLGSWVSLCCPHFCCLVATSAVTVSVVLPPRMSADSYLCHI